VKEAADLDHFRPDFLDLPVEFDDGLFIDGGRRQEAANGGNYNR
jgi:hypothetical protein